MFEFSQRGHWTLGESRARDFSPARPDQGSFQPAPTAGRRPAVATVAQAAGLKGQFITTQNTRDYGHQFVWTGGAFVELQPPPPHDAPVNIPGFPGTWYFSDIVHPTSIHNDGSIWGTADETLTPQGAASSLGGEVRWDLSGNPTVTLNFSSANYFLRTGSKRNEKGSFLRCDKCSTKIFWSRSNMACRPPGASAWALTASA